MTKTIRVNVTRRDIERGVPGRSDICPVARAVRRNRGMWRAYVGHEDVLRPDGTVIASLPADARAFIQAFDHDGPVAPFRFELEVSE